MRYFILIALLLTSCKTIVSTPPLTEQTPDVINKPTETVVAKETTVELPKNTWMKTDSESQTEVKLKEDTVATVKPTEEEIIKEPVVVLLPKNTEVILPENTDIHTADVVKADIEAKSEVILPVGTEITITKVNWYAILFYAVAISGLVYLYLNNKNEDKNNDGFEDTEQETKKSDSAPS